LQWKNDCNDVQIQKKKEEIAFYKNKRNPVLGPYCIFILFILLFIEHEHQSKASVLTMTF